MTSPESESLLLPVMPVPVQNFLLLYRCQSKYLTNNSTLQSQCFPVQYSQSLLVYRHLIQPSFPFLARRPVLFSSALFNISFLENRDLPALHVSTPICIMIWPGKGTYLVAVKAPRKMITFIICFTLSV